MQTDIIGVTIGIIGILIGIVVSYYFYKKSIRIKEPICSIKSNNVISGYASKYQYLKVTYKNNKVGNFTISKLLLYNRGFETITKQDINTINHLRIIGKDNIEILDAKIVQVNNPSNNLDLFLDKKPYIEKQKKIYLIEFDYLDKNQGAVIEVIHNGLSSEDIDIVGDIVGAQKLTKLSPSSLTKAEEYEFGFSSYLRKLFSNVFFPISFFIATVFIIRWVNFYVDILSSKSIITEALRYLLFTLFFTTFLVSLFQLFKTTSDFISINDKSKVIPKGLEIFFDESNENKKTMPNLHETT